MLPGQKSILFISFISFVIKYLLSPAFLFQGEGTTRAAYSKTNPNYLCDQFCDRVSSVTCIFISGRGDHACCIAKNQSLLFV